MPQTVTSSLPHTHPESKREKTGISSGIKKKKLFSCICYRLHSETTASTVTSQIPTDNHNHHSLQLRYYFTQHFQFSCLNSDKPLNFLLLVFNHLNTTETITKFQEPGLTAVANSASHLSTNQQQTSRKILGAFCSQKQALLRKNAACFKLPLEEDLRFEMYYLQNSQNSVILPLKKTLTFSTKGIQKRLIPNS